MQTMSKYAKQVGSMAMVLGMVVFASFIAVASSGLCRCGRHIHSAGDIGDQLYAGLARLVARPCGGHLWASVGHCGPVG